MQVDLRSGPVFMSQEPLNGSNGRVFLIEYRRPEMSEGMEPEMLYPGLTA
jgi:hypothetical protein